MLTIEALLDDDLSSSLPLLPDTEAEPAKASGSAPAQPMEVEGGGGGARDSADVPAARGGGGGAEAMVGVEPTTSAWSTFLLSLLRGLSSSAVSEQKQLVKAITRLLPLVTRGQPELIDQLLHHFVPYSDFDAYDERKHTDESHTFMLECFVATLSGVKPGSALAQRVKAKVLEHDHAGVAAAYLVRQLPANLDAGSQQWSAALAKPALPFVLQLLGGLAKGHVGIQMVLLSTDLMSRLHALERQSSSASKAIGTLAESLLEALRERAAADVDRLRRETTETKRKAALDKRKRMLKSMGMGTHGKTIVAQTVSPSMAMDLEEETGYVCVVCGEGETYRPGEALGCYTFCKRVPLIGGGGSSSLSPGRSAAAISAGVSASEMGYSSVSHFNLIHFACHRDATRAERTLKQPKEEWEGATLRNSQTKCNNLLPIQSSTIGEEAYAICVEQWWASLSSCGRVDAPRVRLLVHDIKLVLLRLALEESFSVDSHGGGRESNLKMLPYLIQMAAFLLDARASPQRRVYQRSLAAFVSACAQEQAPASGGGGGGSGAGAGSDSAFYMLTLSLLVHSPAEWEAARLPMLRRACAYWRGAGQTRERFPLLGPGSPSSSPAMRPSRSPAFAPSRSPLDPSAAPLDSAAPAAAGSAASGPNADGGGASGGGGGGGSTGGGSSSGGGGSSAAPPLAATTPSGNGGTPFADVRPALLFFALVDRLHSILKPPAASLAEAADGGTPTSAAADEGGGAAGGGGGGGGGVGSPAAERPTGGWVAAMRTKMQTQDQAVLKEMAGLLGLFEEELLPAADASEVFDVLGLLGLVADAGGNANALLGA